MSIIGALKHELGIVEGILIPGASVNTVNLTHTVQQTIADAYGPAISAAITTLATDDTKSGRDKAAIITGAVASDIVAKGFKAELKTLKDVVLDIVQAAYRAIEPSIGADMVSLATVLHTGPALTTVAEIAAPLIQAEADKLLPTPAAAPAA